MARRRQAHFLSQRCRRQEAGGDVAALDLPHKVKAQGLCRRLDDIAGEIPMM
jgi:hypothetical protein